ncbi:Succinylglutamate desuccinylase / Aspartoacylase family protein [compost metagenome]
MQLKLLFKEGVVMLKEITLHFLTMAEAKANQCPDSIAAIHERFEGEEAIFFRLNGMKEGPAVWVQAALHGDEYDGILACMHLIEWIDTKELKGSVTISPVTNPNAFLAKSNGHPIDQVNMNRIFSDPSMNSYSYRYGRWLLGQIMDQTDYFIDLHGGGHYLEVCPFAMVASNDKEAFKQAMRLLRDVELTAIYECSEQSKGMFINEVCRLGIPAVLLESGGGLSWTSEDVVHHVQSVLSMLAQASMLPAVQLDNSRDRKTYCVKEITELRFEVDGLQLQHASAGAIVKKGDVLLEVMSYPDFLKKSIVNPLDQALVLSIHTASSLKKGEYAVMLGKIEKK